MRIIAQPLGMLLTALYDIIGSYGLTLIIFTIIVRTALLPLYINQMKSTARMGEMQPKMKAIQNKYAHDKELMNQKMSELYKEEKYNPMKGCLPMLIQFPIIIGLFSLLRNSKRSKAMAIPTAITAAMGYINVPPSWKKLIIAFI